MINKRAFWLLGGIFLFTSCVPITAVPVETDTFISTPISTKFITQTLTPYPTFAPTFTSTPQPPLVEHEWQPERVLLSFKFTRGDGGGDIMPPLVPKFILYADGHLFVTHPTGDSPEYREQLLIKKLDRKEICRNLNTLDQIGFLDYDPSSYEFIGGSPNIMGAPGASIEVNTWKTHTSTSYYELGIYMYDEIYGKLSADLLKQGVDIKGRQGFPVILPALHKAYYFFTEYPLDDFEVYIPERIAVWLQPFDFGDLENIQSAEWILKKPSLANMFDRINFDGSYSNSRYLVLFGEEAQAVYNFLDKSYSTDYYYEVNKNGENTYYILQARPLFPYELPGEYDSQIPASGSTRPDFKLICYPSDGIFAISTPAIP